MAAIPLEVAPPPRGVGFTAEGEHEHFLPGSVVGAQKSNHSSWRATDPQTVMCSEENSLRMRDSGLSVQSQEMLGFLSHTNRPAWNQENHSKGESQTQKSNTFNVKEDKKERQEQREGGDTTSRP